MVISIIFTILSILIIIALNLFSLFASAFLEKINVVNSVALGLVTGIVMYIDNRMINFVMNKPLSAGVCIGTGAAVAVIAYLIQKTKIGFWGFAVIFSVLWAFVSSMILYTFVTTNNIWFWIVFILSFIMNMGSHLRTRDN